MRFDFFYRAEGKNFSRDDERYLICEVDVDSGDFQGEGWMPKVLTLALEEAYANGMSKGSYRSGCFQIQCDLGIFNHVTQNKIDPQKPQLVTFKTWEQFDQESV
jgi:hypothetical protein